MNPSRTLGQRTVVAAAALTLTLGLAACSGSDAPPPPDEPTATPTASASVNPAQSAADQALLKGLVNQYWAAATLAAEAGDDSGQQFDGVTESGVADGILDEIRDATAEGATRDGAPEVSQVDVSIDGDTAGIVACLDQDSWPLVKDGVAVDATPRGLEPWGATAKRDGDAWILTAAGVTDDRTKAKDCG